MAYGFEATYCPEDNKLRLYIGRVDRETYDRLRSLKYKSTPKQDCDFVATWSTQSEDIALELCGDIGDEDQSPQDRAADRAERFEGYRGRRLGEALGHADDFDAGPSVHGYQSQAKAERSAKKHDRYADRAVTQWSKAEYWQTRTDGVISNALYKSQPQVRRGRILKLEAKLRKLLKSTAEAQGRYDKWTEVAGMTGADALLPLNESGFAILKEMNEAQRLVYSLANDSRSSFRIWHPTSEKANAKAKEIWGHGFSTYDFLTHDDFIGEPFERFTPKQMADLYLGKLTRAEPGRLCNHYEMRIAYETQMIGEEGGRASEVDIEPGGFFGKHQVVHVHRSPVTKAVVSVSMYGEKDYWKGEGPTPKVLKRVNIQRLPEGSYRPPSEEEREQFETDQKQRKAKTKEANAGKPKLINPNIEDAEKLQAEMNQVAAANRKADPVDVVLMTQAQYSIKSKGSYSHCKAMFLFESGIVQNDGYGARRLTKICKLRIYTSGRSYGGAYRLIVLTDKPQKALPNWLATKEKVPT